MYADAEPISAPSDPEGRLAVPASLPARVTLWDGGWLPVTAETDALPAEVAFEAANASIELRLLHASAEHRLLRGLITPRWPDRTPQGPWTPGFAERGFDRYVAGGVRPGSYDVYVWIVDPTGEPRPYSRPALAVEPGGVARWSIDLAAPRDSDDLEPDG